MTTSSSVKVGWKAWRNMMRCATESGGNFSEISSQDLQINDSQEHQTTLFTDTLESLYIRKFKSPVKESRKPRCKELENVI